MLATLEQLKTYIWESGSDNDGLLNIFLQWANDTILQYIGRNIEEDTYTELVNWAWQLNHILHEFPVKTITSVKVNTGTNTETDWETLTIDDYSFDNDTGILHFMSPMNRGFKNYEIVYRAWYNSVPADIVLATVELASMKRNTKGASGISSESVAGDSITYSKARIPESIALTLDQYKDVSVS